MMDTGLSGQVPNQICEYEAQNGHIYLAEKFRPVCAKGRKLTIQDAHHLAPDTQYICSSGETEPKRNVGLGRYHGL